METSEIMALIDRELYIIAVALWVIGLFLKKIPNVPDWTIPFVLTFAGIALSAGTLGAVNATAVIQGILCAGVAVLVNQLGKQGLNGLLGVDAVPASSAEAKKTNDDDDAHGGQSYYGY